MGSVAQRRVGVAAAAVAALALAGTASAETLVIRVVSVTTASKLDDTKPDGPSKGDRLTLSSRLVNTAAQFGKPRGAVVGSDHGTITFTTHSRVVVDGVARLPGGTIHFRGRQVFGSTDPLPVVGGTGRYAGARGTMTIDERAQTNTYRLTLPLVA